MTTAYVEEEELTGEQIEQQDIVDNAIHHLLEELAGRELEWNITHISAVRESVQDVLCGELKFMTEKEFYAYFVVEDDGAALPDQTPYAGTHWTIEDIKNHAREKDGREITDDEAREFLEEHGDDIREAMTAAGWDVIGMQFT